MMIFKIGLLALFAALLTACGSQENERLQSQVDSLSHEVAINKQMVGTLEEVGSMLDSIDASRRLLRVNMIEGTTYDDYSSRMKDLNFYVREAEGKIDELEKSLGSSKSLASSYSRTIKKLKEDLQVKATEILNLQGQVDKYRNENQNLIELANLQESELTDRQSQIDAKQEELALLESKIQHLMIQSKLSEADATYAHAQSVEEAANRTKLAPRKKKETLAEALELYKKALSLGKKEASAKIKELEKEM